MKKLKLVMLLSFLVGFTAHAQQAITASGGDATGSGGKVAFSVGQIVYTTNTGATGTVAQGVQQPYEISVVSGIRNNTALDITLSVYPNPTTDNLTLQIQEYKNEKISYQLLDMQGRLLDSNQITESQTQVNMSNLAAAVYFINVMDENNKIKSFKIIKN